MGMFDDLIPTKGATPDTAKPAGMFDDLIPAKSKAYKGTILPFSKNEKGETSFDPSAGVLGIVGNLVSSAKSAASLPKEVYDGTAPDLKSPEGFKRVMDLVSVATSMNPAVRAGDSSVLLKGGVNKAPAPTTQALKQAGGEGFDAARAAGAEYSGDTLRGLGNALRARLEAKGIEREAAPATYQVIQKLERLGLDNVSDYARVKSIRDRFLDAGGTNIANKVEGKAAREGVQMIDDFLTRPPPYTASGPVATTAKLHRDALDNYAAGMRAEKLDKMLTKAELGASSTGSGMNFDNVLRQKARSILGNDKQRAGYNKTEIAALEAFVEGTAGRNTLRRIGNMLGGGGGVGSVVSGGAAAYTGQQMFGPVGQAAFFAPGIVGGMVKGAQNRMARRDFQNIADLVRQNAPLMRQHGSIPGYAPTMGRELQRPNFARVPGLLNAFDDEQ